MTAYRGDGEATPERLRALDEEIAGLEAKLSDVFWEHVAPVWGVADGLLATLGPLEARHERIAELQALIERARHGPAAEAELKAPPAPPEGVLASFGRVLTEPPTDIAVGFLAACHVHAPDAVLAHRKNSLWGVRLRADGAPIEVALSYQTRNNNNYYVAMGVTSVAPAARLELEPEGILQDLLEMIGLRREIELGDPAFDPAFLIRGDETTARAFLSPAARRALLAIGEEADVRVTIARGRARVLTHATSRRAVARVIEILAAWHAQPSPHPLLREP